MFADYSVRIDVPVNIDPTLRASHPPHQGSRIRASSQPLLAMTQAAGSLDISERSYPALCPASGLLHLIANPTNMYRHTLAELKN